MKAFHWIGYIDWGTEESLMGVRNSLLSPLGRLEL